jgi:hypothetical protein
MLHPGLTNRRCSPKGCKKIKILVGDVSNLKNNEKVVEETLAQFRKLLGLSTGGGNTFFCPLE